MTAESISDALPRPPTLNGSCPPIADHALIGDGSTAALVGIDGTIRWLCLPRFDGPALFAALLDAQRGGQWSIQPSGLRAVTQYYLPDTAVVVTDLECDTGTARITDAMLTTGSLDARSASATGELARLITVLDGEVDLRIHLDGRGGLAPTIDQDGPGSGGPTTQALCG